MYGKYLNLTNDTTKVAKSHSHCQNCLQVSRLQSLLRRTAAARLELRRGGGTERRQLCPARAGRARALDRPAERAPGKDRPETCCRLTPGSRHAPPPAVNPRHALTAASTHIKHTVISLMCCSSEGERQAD